MASILNSFGELYYHGLSDFQKAQMLFNQAVKNLGKSD
jgi:hypothetical protein